MSVVTVIGVNQIAAARSKVTSPAAAQIPEFRRQRRLSRR